MLHRCDTPACCNPSHLFLGTAKANHDDMAAKGRRVGRVRLSTVAVVAIKARLASGELQYVLAKEYGVHKTTISWIARGKRAA